MVAGEKKKHFSSVCVQYQQMTHRFQSVVAHIHRNHTAVCPRPNKNCFFVPISQVLAICAIGTTIVVWRVCAVSCVGSLPYAIVAIIFHANRAKLTAGIMCLLWIQINSIAIRVFFSINFQKKKNSFAPVERFKISGMMNGDNNNFDTNHLELFSRRHSSRDVPSTNSRDPNRAASNKRYSLSATSSTANRQTSINGEEPHSSAISIISGSRSTVSRTPSNVSAKNKPRRKKSATGSDHTDRSDSSRVKSRNILTSSFLRRKRVEYAGNWEEG